MRSAAQDRFVSLVESELAALMPERSAGTLVSAARHLVFAGGRRLRVRLVSMCGEYAGAPPDDLVAVASAAELIHAASLLHDDIVDEARERRGKPSANAAFGNQAAVLAGDWVLSKAVTLLERQPGLIVSAVKTVGEMSEAAIDEIEGRGSIEVDFARWRRVAEGKTGALFGWCASAAVMSGRTPSLGASFETFGRHLGVAFQLADDVSDLLGAHGKDRFSDLRSRTPSYPILLAMQNDERFATSLAEAWAEPAMNEAHVLELGERMLALGIRDASLAAMNQELETAFVTLGPDAQDFSRRLRGLADVFIAPLLST